MFLLNIYTHCTLPGVFTHLQWMLWQMFMVESCKLPINPPQGSLTGWALGDHLTTALLWHYHIFTSFRSGLACGVGLVHLSHAWQTPIHKGMPTSDAMRRSQFWWRMCDWLHWSVTSVGGDVCCDLMYHLTCLLFPPIPDLLLSLKGISLH